MSLFNPKTLNRYLKADVQIPTDQLTLLENWAELIRSNQIYRLKEVALHGDFKARIVEGVLGYISAMVLESLQNQANRVTPHESAVLIYRVPQANICELHLNHVKIRLFDSRYFQTLYNLIFYP